MNPSSLPATVDVIVVGVYFCDLIFTGLPHLPVLSQEITGSGFDMLPGGTFNLAHALHRLEVRVGWWCDFGSDYFSQFVIDTARAAGMDDRFFRIRDTPLRNVTVSLSFAHDRAFVTYTDLVKAEAVADLLDNVQARCVALPSLYHKPDLLPLSERVHAQGGLLFMDCSQVLVTLDTPGITDALRAVDIFAPNTSEALQLTGTTNLDDALDMLSELTPLIVVKQGAHGAVARQGTTTVHVPALPGLTVVDTTGAGDCFNAGFLHGYLRGETLERCLQWGNVVGGLSTTARGTYHAPALPTAQRYLAAYTNR